jgi:alpha-L-rhamnosidase
MGVSGAALTQRGRVPIAWNRAAPGHFSLDVTVPVNTVATIHVPAPDASAVSDGHARLARDPGVISVRSAPGDVVLTVGSGHYELHVPALAPRSTRSFSWGVAVLAAIGVGALLASVGWAVRRRRGLWGITLRAGVVSHPSG